jgi:hypothetical protein
MTDKGRRRVKIAVGIVGTLLIGGLLADQYIRATDTWVPRPLWDGETVQVREVSPDGQFEAEIIYLNGMTFGIQYVRLRDLRHPIIPFAKKVAITTFDQAKKLKWKSNREVVIIAEPAGGQKPTLEECFEMRETTCFDVKISYRLDGV